MWRKQRDEAFEAFFHAIFPRAVGVANRILANITAAEDVAAEALARAYSDWKNIVDLPYRDGWVLRVTTNVALDTARRKRPSLEVMQPPDLEEAATSRVVLSMAIRALPRRQREIVAMRHLAGMSEAEVASALGIAPGTVKAHGHRAMMSLRERLGDSVAEGSL